jgi:hypothetical protein
MDSSAAAPRSDIEAKVQNLSIFARRTIDRTAVLRPEFAAVHDQQKPRVALVSQLERLESRLAAVQDQEQKNFERLESRLAAFQDQEQKNFEREQKQSPHLTHLLSNFPVLSVPSLPILQKLHPLV